MGRPAVDLFLRYPRSDNRKQTVICFKTELITLDLFYRADLGKTGKPKRLQLFLADGSSDENAAKYENFDFNIDDLKFGPKTETFEQTHKEISEDIEAFIDYMKNSVYFGITVVH